MRFTRSFVLLAATLLGVGISGTEQPTLPATQEHSEAKELHLGPLVLSVICGILMVAGGLLGCCYLRIMLRHLTGRCSCKVDSYAAFRETILVWGLVTTLCFAITYDLYQLSRAFYLQAHQGTKLPTSGTFLKNHRYRILFRVTLILLIILIYCRLRWGTAAFLDIASKAIDSGKEEDIQALEQWLNRWYNKAFILVDNKRKSAVNQKAWRLLTMWAYASFEPRLPGGERVVELFKQDTRFKDYWKKKEKSASGKSSRGIGYWLNWLSTSLRQFF